jgi:tRNA-splicing ligase RtcB
MSKNIKIVGTDVSVLADSAGISVLEEISQLPNIHLPCIALPDFHYKEKMETPSSVAIAVRGHLVPHFSSTSLNCGMGAIVLDIDCAKELEGNLAKFFNHIRKNRDNKKYNLTPGDLFKVLEFGPKALLDKHGIEESLLDSFEFRGNVHRGNSYDFSEFEKAIPEGTLEHAEYSGLDKLGTNFSGNHFLEVQKVTEILDEELAGQKGVHSVGQAVIMYHGGGGIIPGLFGAFFSRRKKGYDDGLKTNIRRYLYHLKRSPGLPLYDLYKHYISNQQYFQFHIDSIQGQRLLFANNCSMNYGYAYRLFK